MKLVASAADRRLLDEGVRTRAMQWVMAVMLFLTVLAAALGLGVLAAERLLDRQLAGRLTVQVVQPEEARRAADTAAAVAALSALPQVERVVEVDRARLAALLQPWLGSDGLDRELPVPAMIDVDLRDGNEAGATAVERAVRAAAPGARVDRHAGWLEPVSDFMRLLTWLALGLVLLMAAATAAVVILAVRAGLDTHRGTIEVLHMLGSTDVQVARLFQRRIAVETLVGGLCGAVPAMLVTLLLGSELRALGSDLLGGIRLDLRGWMVLVMLPLLFALLSAVAARLAVLAALRRVL